MKAQLSILLVTFLGSSLLGGQSGVVRRVISSYQGKSYQFVILRSDVEPAPVWAEKDNNPPLPARVAMKAAQEFATRFIPDSGGWIVNRVSLEPLGQQPGWWIYVVEYTAFGVDAPLLLGPGRTFLIPVLMNGTIVAPNVTTLKEPKKLG